MPSFLRATLAWCCDDADAAYHVIGKLHGSLGGFASGDHHAGAGRVVVDGAAAVAGMDAWCEIGDIWIIFEGISSFDRLHDAGLREPVALGNGSVEA